MEKSKKRLIHVCQIWNYYPPLFAGGALRYNQLTPLLKKLDIEIEVLTPQWRGLLVEEVIGDTKVRRISIGPLNNRTIQRLISAFGLFWQFLKRSKSYDVLHAVSVDYLYIPTYLLAKLLGVPVIIDFTIMISKNQSVLGNLISKLSIFAFGIMDAYIGNSPPLVKQMQERGLSSEKCHLISNGVFTDKFQPLMPDQRTRLRSDLGLQQGIVYLLFVGNFVQRKGADILVETMIRLCEKHKDIHLIVIGKHSFSDHPKAQLFADEQKKIIRMHSLDSYIKFLGLLDHSEYLLWLQACDIFFFPSRREGFGRVIAEAMAVELPCVCSPIDGIVYELFEPNVSGIVVEDSHPDNFANQIEKLAANQSLRISIGSKARERAVERFDEKKIVTEFKRLYEELLAKPG